MRYIEGTIIRTNAPYDHRATYYVKQRPESIGLLLDERLFNALNGYVEHHKTVFILDEMHDWDYCEKRNAIRVYGSIDPDDPFDIVVAYEIEDDKDGHKI